MQGMDMGSGAAASCWALAEIAVFWSVAVLHLMRVLAASRLPDPDPGSDAGHALMGAGMTLMVFPGAPAGTGRLSASLFTVLAAVFLSQPVLRPGGWRAEDAALGAALAAMAVMFLAPGHRPAVATMVTTVVLAGCALIHGQSLLRARHRHYERSEGGEVRLLATLPHVGTVVMTLAMAAMVAVA
jgi:hypothetical protein